MKGRVEQVGAGGDGIIRADGGDWYVPATAPGDLIEFSPVRDKSRVRRGSLETVLEPGPDRVQPDCPHFGRCGGCALQHLAPGYLSDWKLGQVRDVLKRRGFDVPDLTMGLEGAPGSRRRVTWSARLQADGAAALGFFERRGRNLIAVRSCPVLEPDLEKLVAPLRKLLPQVLPRRTEARVQVNLTDGGADLLIEGPVTEGLEAHEALSGFADEHDLARISISEGDGGLPRTILMRRPPVLRWGQLRVMPPPGAFLQADRRAEALMRATVAEWSGGAKAVVDLFSGVGTLISALPLGSDSLAVDSDAAAIGALKTALDAAEENAGTEVRNLFRRPLQAEELARFDLAVLDPPAAGAREQCAALAASTIGRVIYISCAPSTFARDARILADAGFHIERVRVIDQFHWAADTELSALLVRD